MEAIIRTVNWVIQAFEFLYKKVRKYIKIINNLIQKLEDWINKCIDWINKFGSGVDQIVSIGIKWIEDQINSVLATVKKWIDSFIKWVKGKYDSACNKIKIKIITQTLIKLGTDPNTLPAEYIQSMAEAIPHPDITSYIPEFNLEISIPNFILFGAFSYVKLPRIPLPPAIDEEEEDCDIHIIEISNDDNNNSNIIVMENSEYINLQKEKAVDNEEKPKTENAKDDDYDALAEKRQYVIDASNAVDEAYKAYKKVMDVMNDPEKSPDKFNESFTKTERYFCYTAEIYGVDRYGNPTGYGLINDLKCAEEEFAIAKSEYESNDTEENKVKFNAAKIKLEDTQNKYNDAKEEYAYAKEEYEIQEKHYNELKQNYDKLDQDYMEKLSIANKYYANLNTVDYNYNDGEITDANSEEAFIHMVQSKPSIEDYISSYEVVDRDKWYHEYYIKTYKSSNKSQIESDEALLAQLDEYIKLCSNGKEVPVIFSLDSELSKILMQTNYGIDIENKELELKYLNTHDDDVVKNPFSMIIEGQLEGQLEGQENEQSTIVSTSQTETSQTANENTEYTTVEKVITHEVKSGETLKSIANKYGTNTSSIKKNNNLTSNVVSRGQTLKITTRILVPVQNQPEIQPEVQPEIQPEVQNLTSVNQEQINEIHKLSVNDKLPVYRNIGFYGLADNGYINDTVYDYSPYTKKSQDKNYKAELENTRNKINKESQLYDSKCSIDGINSITMDDINLLYVTTDERLKQWNDMCERCNSSMHKLDEPGIYIYIFTVVNGVKKFGFLYSREKPGTSPRREIGKPDEASKVKVPGKPIKVKMLTHEESNHRTHKFTLWELKELILAATFNIRPNNANELKQPETE